MDPATLIQVFYFFVIGAVFGSFLNMLVYRVHHGLNLFGRSFCDKSKKSLKPVDLIPILSYIIFKGRCRDCGTKLPLLYPVVELTMGILSVLCLFKGIPLVSDQTNLLSILPLWALLFSVVFIFVYFAYYDLLYWEIDALSVKLSLGYAILLVVLDWILVSNGSQLAFFGDPVSHLLGGLVFGGLILITYVLTKGGGMGEGDIYLLALSGLVLGVTGGLMAFLLTSVLGSLVGLVIAYREKKLHGLRIQLGPFIALGTLILWFWKDPILLYFFGIIY